MKREHNDAKSGSERWGEFRFSVIGHLLSAPPCLGELHTELKQLSKMTWRHPITGEPVRFGFSTIERWYYAALREKRSPVKRLCRQVRSDCGNTRRMSHDAIALLQAQYRAHPSWSKQLHADNLRVALTSSSEAAPSYSTLVRFMNRQGLVRQPCPRRANAAGLRAALLRKESYEVRSFESAYVGALFHLDFHHCSRQIITPRDGWVTPRALAIMDDCSRFICHLQWYISEQTEDLVHGVIQAFLKVGLPQALMTDNGSAMTSAEFVCGLTRTSITHTPTLEYSPYQNGKQERFFGTLEGRLLAMCEALPNLTLERLNYITQAWLTREYLEQRHDELGTSPAKKFVDSKHLLHHCPTLDELRMAFRRRVSRKQRRTDNTVCVNGTRFEIPARYRTLSDITLEYASWDLSFVHLIDHKTGDALCRVYPIDKIANATAERRKLLPAALTQVTPATEEPPLLRKILQDYAATGLPPGYIPKTDSTHK